MSNKVLIIVLGVFLLMMGTMGAGFFVLWSKMSTMAHAQDAGHGEKGAGKAKEEEPAIGHLRKLDTMIVNLADQGGKRYLRTTMELELSAPEVDAEVEKRLPQLRDSILMILPTKQYAEISTTEGKTALRDELIAKLNTYLKTGTVKTIYFTEFVVQ